MKYKFQYFLAFILLTTVSNVKAQTKSKIDVWLTNPDKSALFTHQDKQLQFDAEINNNPVIKIDDKQTYQSMVGFGFALTGGSATHIINMSAESRSKLLQDVFGTKGNDIGVSYLRLSI
ncbi:MAG: glucosylceramidase, partial [Bacteroidia bacterium]